MPGSYVRCSVCEHREPVVNHDWAGAWTKCLAHEGGHDDVTDRSADPIAGRVAPSAILKLITEWRATASRNATKAARRDYDPLDQQVYHIEGQTLQACADELEAALADPPVGDVPPPVDRYEKESFPHCPPQRVPELDDIEDKIEAGGDVPQSQTANEHRSPDGDGLTVPRWPASERSAQSGPSVPQQHGGLDNREAGSEPADAQPNSAVGDVERRASEGPKSWSGQWLVIRKRETDPIEVFVFDRYDKAAVFFDDAQAQWSDTFLCRVAYGPGYPNANATAERLQLMASRHPPAFGDVERPV